MLFSKPYLLISTFNFKNMNRDLIFTKNILILLCLGLFLISCVNTPEKTPFRKKENNFTIFPQEIGIDEPFKIGLPDFRPSKLAIKTPSNEWYIIHDVDENIFILPLIEFEKSNTLVIIPSQLKGVVWKNGQRLIRKVFNTPGEYFIYLADNLETEPENTFSFEGTVTLK